MNSLELYLAALFNPCFPTLNWQGHFPFRLVTKYWEPWNWQSEWLTKAKTITVRVRNEHVNICQIIVIHLWIYMSFRGQGLLNSWVCVKNPINISESLSQGHGSNLKGSTCQCHYCKCERGLLYCQHHNAFTTYGHGQYYLVREEGFHLAKCFRNNGKYQQSHRQHVWDSQEK